MKSRKPVLLALAIAGACLCVGVWLAAPHLLFWLAKNQTIRHFAALPADTRELMELRLSKQVRKLSAPAPASTPAAAAASILVDGCVVTVLDPAFQVVQDPNQKRPHFASPKLHACVLSCAGALPSASSAQTRQDAFSEVFGAADPFQVLVDCYSTTPSDLQAVQDHNELRRVLLLLTLRAMLQTNGSGKLWVQFEGNGRRGILSGDGKAGPCIVTIYLPETKACSDLTIALQPGATIDDVWAFLASVRFEQAAKPLATPK